jgi:hypothetical protein
LSRPNITYQEISLFEDLFVLAVETRAQRKRKEDREKKDEEATAASGVVLATPQYRRRKSKFKTGGRTQEEDPTTNVTTRGDAHTQSVAESEQEGRSRPQEDRQRNNVVTQDETLTIDPGNLGECF